MIHVRQGLGGFEGPSSSGRAVGADSIIVADLDPGTRQKLPRPCGQDEQSRLSRLMCPSFVLVLFYFTHCPAARAPLSLAMESALVRL